MPRERLAADKQGIDWLFVGRLVPNKAQHDLVLAFALHSVASPGSRLWLVGRTDSPRYETALRHLIAALDLGDTVTITGPVDDATLAAYYRDADVFVSASEHEGFCLPLVEAMHQRLPVVAHASSAVAETLGDAGICITDKRPHAIAAAVERAVAPSEPGAGPGSGASGSVRARPRPPAAVGRAVGVAGSRMSRRTPGR